MLPEVLSNGLCSLKPQVDRLALAVEMVLTRDGSSSEFRFCEAVIHSHARLTYTRWPRCSSPAQRGGAGDLVPHLQQLHALYKALRRRARSAVPSTSKPWRRASCSTRSARSTRSCRCSATMRTSSSRSACCAPTWRRRASSSATRCPCCTACTRVPSAEKLENLRAYLGELGLGLRGGATPTRGLPAPARADCRARRRAHRADHAAALAQPGGLPAENKGHFRPQLPRLRALHVADPALSGSARTPRDPQRDPLEVRSKLVQARARCRELERTRIYPYDEAADGRPSASAAR
jgi:ribonuclease R